MGRLSRVAKIPRHANSNVKTALLYGSLFWCQNTMMNNFRCTKRGFSGKDIDSATQLPCEADPVTGLFSKTCRYAPERVEGTSASILYAEYLDGVSRPPF